MPSDVISINIEIEDLPVVVNKRVNAIAQMRGIRKKDAVREALVEYAQRHTEEAVRAFRADIKKGE